MPRTLSLVVLAGLLLLTQAKVQRLESSTWQARSSVPAAGGHGSSQQEAAVARSMKLLRQHPAVHTLQDLGIWSTQHFGRLPPSIAASVAAAALPEGAGAARRLSAAAWGALKATIPHGGSPAVLLQHWWRLRCTDDEQQPQNSSSGGSSPTGVSNMELRGLGTATVSMVSLGVSGRWRGLWVWWLLGIEMGFSKLSSRECLEHHLAQGPVALACRPVCVCWDAPHAP